jgi:hypothetical protein
MQQQQCLLRLVIAVEDVLQEATAVQNNVMLLPHLLPPSRIREAAILVQKPQLQ